MFSGIGVLELLVIGSVGLIVIGPDKLPGTIKTCALWIGRIKRSIGETRREIEQQLGADEIRRELQNEQILASLEKFKEQTRELERDINAQVQAGENEGEIHAHEAIEHDPHHDDEHFDEHYHHDGDVHNGDAVVSAQPAKEEDLEHLKQYYEDISHGEQVVDPHEYERETAKDHSHTHGQDNEPQQQASSSANTDDQASTNSNTKPSQ